MNIEEFKTKYILEDDWGDCYGDDDLIRVAHDDGIEHKTAWHNHVYKVNNEYFEVTWCRGNTGYWGDGERYDPEVRKVKPVIVEVTQWVEA